MMSTWLLSDLQTELYFSMLAKKKICNVKYSCGYDGKICNSQEFKILKSPYLPKNASFKMSNFFFNNTYWPS